MKKGLVVLAVLAMAAPLYAGTITFTATDNGPMGPPATCTITWTSDVPIVAFGLDIDADTPVDIYSIDSFFDIFMDLAYDIETDGDPCTNYGYGQGNGDASNAAADPSAAGQVSLPSAYFTISAGGLGGQDPCNLTPPPTSGTLFVLSSGVNTEGTIIANVLRGGVVDDDGAEVALAGDLDWMITVTAESVDCMTDAGIDVSDPCEYAEFLAAGSPECWCYPTQCEGDTDGLTEGGPALGYYHVGIIDVGVLAEAWRVSEPTKGPGITTVTVSTVNGPVKGACADFDHRMEGGPALGYYRVGIVDVGILAGTWRLAEPTKGPGLAKTCVPGTESP